MQTNDSPANSCCDRDHGTPDTYNDTVRSPISADGRPVLATTYVVPARHARAVKLDARQIIRITNTHGTQVCDLWVFNRNDLNEYFSIEHTRGKITRVNPVVGDVLLTNRRRPILRFDADTSSGIHDTLIGACDVGRYVSLGFEGYHDNCADNLRQALLAIGLRARAVPQPLNLWMNIPVSTEGLLSFQPTVSKPDDFVEFTASMDCVVVMSACPMDLNGINGKKPVDVHFEVRERN